MPPFANFGIEFGLSFLISALLARWYAWPYLAKRRFEDALLVLLLPFLPRYLGLMSLVPGVVDPVVTQSKFAFYQAYGDFLAFILAFIAFLAVRSGKSYALSVVWIFNVFGTVDFIHSVLRGILSDTDGGLGAFWYIPVAYVPLGLVVHFMIFVLLARRSREYQRKATAM